MPTVKYVGNFDEVVIYDGQLEKSVKKDDTVDVSDSLAHGDADAGLGGLLDQETNWELVEAPTPVADPTEESS